MKLKRFGIILSCAVLILSVAGVASAIPYNWSETIDWDPDVKLNWHNSWFNYCHDLGNDGFNAGLDFVESYELTIRLYDDADRHMERAFIWQPGIPVPERWGGDPDVRTRYDFALQDVEIGWTLLGLLDINYDGTLHLSIQRQYGDFYVDWSRIDASGIKGDYTDTAPVPEPATMLLLGTGLAGMAAAGKRKKKK
jgi:hypothetical protein